MELTHKQALDHILAVPDDPFQELLAKHGLQPTLPGVRFERIIWPPKIVRSAFSLARKLDIERITAGIFLLSFIEQNTADFCEATGKDVEDCEELAFSLLEFVEAEEMVSG